MLMSHSHTSDIYSDCTKDHLDALVKYFVANVHDKVHSIGRQIGFLKANNACKTVWSDLQVYCILLGISIQEFSSYAPESNEIDERLVQEHWMKARAQLFGFGLPKALWGEALHYA